MALLRLCQFRSKITPLCYVRRMCNAVNTSDNLAEEKLHVNLGPAVSNGNVKQEIDAMYQRLLSDYSMESTVNGKTQCILRRAARYAVERDNYKKKLDSLKWQGQERALWRVTVRAAMDDFEEQYGQNAVIDRSKFPQDISFNERTKQVRNQRILWILHNKSNEWKVKQLIAKINKSGAYSSMEEFSESYAIAYYVLSEVLKKRLLYPGVGDDFVGLTTDEDSNVALKVFMELFVFPSEVVIRKSRKADIKNASIPKV